MQKHVYNYKIAAVVSGLLALIANVYINFAVGIICYVPLFIALQKVTPKESFKAGFLFCLTLSLTSLYWMVPGAERFTGQSSFYGIIVYIVSTLISSFYFGVVNCSYNVLQLKSNNRFTFLLNGLLISCIYVIAETLLSILANGMPWFGYHSGTSMLNNTYAIQPASFGGIHLLSFMAVLINYLIAYSIVNKQWIRLAYPAVILSVYFLLGYSLQKAFDNSLQRNVKPVTLAILCENIEPEIRWNDSTGNMLVAQLLNLDREAASIKPGLTLWSESAVPWTYRPNDDLVNELLKITKPANTTHILGINTDYHDNVVYNSVYCLLPDGKITGRYDKRFLLSLIEAPVAGVYFPFFSSSGFLVKKGKSSKPLPTPYGKAGVMICNESAVASTAADMVKNGAQFLVNLSNDGWFNNTYLVDQHFYNVRLRAVENRKDIAINSNNGYCGLADASGNIILKEMSTEPFVRTVSVAPNTYTTIATRMPLLFVYLCAAGLICFIIRYFAAAGKVNIKRN